MSTVIVQRAVISMPKGCRETLRGLEYGHILGIILKKVTKYKKKNNFIIEKSNSREKNVLRLNYSNDTMPFVFPINKAASM